MARGRPKKPLELQSGNLTKEIQETKELEEQEIRNLNKNQLAKPPTWLRDSTAKKEWKRLNKELEEISVICNLDYNNLGAYCNAYSFYVQATKELDKEPLITEFTNKAGATNFIENPLIRIQLKYSEEMKKFASLLGLTIDSRLKIATIKNQNNQNDLVDDFGDI